MGISYHWIKIGMNSIGCEIKLPVILINGFQDGPTLYVGAAIHGDELNGTAVIQKIMTSIDLEKLKGRLILVTVQNPIAFHLKHGFISREFYDAPEGNVYAAFPGSPTGQLSERLAHSIFQLVLNADYAIDLHTSGSGNAFITHAFCFFTETVASAKARELAQMFGTLFVTDMRTGGWTSENMFLEAANRRGVPAFGVELGPGACIDPKAVAIGYRGMLNVMRYLGMIEGAVAKNPDQFIVDRIVPARAQQGGFLQHTVKLGARVNEGQKLAKVYDLHFREIESIKAPATGIVHSQKTYMTINTSERAALVGVPSVS